MNSDKVEGEGREIGGKVKETIGDVTGDQAMKDEGLADQITGNVQQGYGKARDAVAERVGPLADQAKRFAREKPFATAALVGTLALAVFNTLRGKKK